MGYENNDYRGHTPYFLNQNKKTAICLKIQSGGSTIFPFVMYLDIIIYSLRSQKPDV
jgi:hypothetical protein